jgi:hypothetical protein
MTALGFSRLLLVTPSTKHGVPGEMAKTAKLYTRATPFLMRLKREGSCRELESQLVSIIELNVLTHMSFAEYKLQVPPHTLTRTTTKRVISPISMAIATQTK